jgi:hypothetical protein
MLDPTWTATNNPHDAPAIASPRRSRTWAAFLTRNCIVVPQQREDIKLGHYSALRKTLLTREAARADQTMLHGRDGPQVRLRSISVPEALAECRDAGPLGSIALRSANQTASRSNSRIHISDFAIHAQFLLRNAAGPPGDVRKVPGTNIAWCNANQCWNNCTHSHLICHMPSLSHVPAPDIS